MSDHVALSIYQISQSEKRTDLQAGHQAGGSEVIVHSALTSESDIPCGACAEIVDASECRGMPCRREIKTHEINAHRNSMARVNLADLALECKGCPSCPSDAVGNANPVGEEATFLLEGDHGKVDRSHVVVPIENGLDTVGKNVPSTALAECRICQEEDDITNLESPCACSGSLKFAHRKCVQHWCDEKGDTLCEICQKPFEGGYTLPQQGRTDNIGLELGAGWDIASGQPRLFTLAADHRFLESDYDEYAGSHAHSAACFRSVAIILVAILLLRHIFSMTGASEDEDVTTFFMLSLVRAGSFLIPCYIMARAMNALQIRHQQQEASIAAAAEVTHLIQTGRIQAIIAAEP